MTILYELADFIEVGRIKMVALFAEVSFDRFSKELRFVCVCLGDFVIMAQCCIIALTLWLEKVLDFAPRLTWIGPYKLIEFQNLSQLSCVSTVMSSLICFCNWLMDIFLRMRPDVFSWRSRGILVPN